MSRAKQTNRYYADLDDEPRGMGCLTAISLFLLASAIVCGIWIIYEIWSYDIGVFAYDKLEASAVSETEASVSLPGYTSDPSGAGENESAGETGGEESSQAEAPKELAVDFELLARTNADITGWLYSAGTDISYPVVQGTDNEFYLTHLFNKSAGKLGTLFVDCTTAAYKSDNTVVFGHNMENGAMLHCLMEYKKQAYYDAHPFMRLYTPEGNYTFALIAAFDLDLRESDNERFYQKDLDETEREWFLQECASRSTFTPNFETPTGAELLTLSTCDNAYDDMRFLVVGWLIPDE